LAAIARPTPPLPDPLLPETIVIQVSLAVALHEHPVAQVTVTLLPHASAENERLAAETE
jgi:hypothetical protein